MKKILALIKTMGRPQLTAKARAGTGFGIVIFDLTAAADVEAINEICKSEAPHLTAKLFKADGSYSQKTGEKYTDIIYVGPAQSSVTDDQLLNALACE